MLVAGALKHLDYCEWDTWTQKEVIVRPKSFWERCVENFGLNIFLEKLTFDRVLPQSNTDVTFPIENALILIRSIGIKISKPAKIREYFLKHSDMLDLALFVAMLSKKMLTSKTYLSLEVYHDLEIEDSYLTLYVRQEKYDEQIMENIDKINSEFEEFLSALSGYIIVTTDFNQPI